MMDILSIYLISNIAEEKASCAFQILLHMSQFPVQHTVDYVKESDINYRKELLAFAYYFPHTTPFQLKRDDMKKVFEIAKILKSDIFDYHLDLMEENYAAMLPGAI